VHHAARVAGERRLDLLSRRAREHDRSVAATKQLGDDRGGVLGSLAGAVHRFRPALPELTVMIHSREAEIGERQPAEFSDRVVGRPGA
jgi:hypothetical protein